MARRDPVEYGKHLASALGRKLDKAAEEALALVAPFHSEIKAFVLSLPVDDTPAPAKKAKPKKKEAKSGGK